MHNIRADNKINPVCLYLTALLAILCAAVVFSVSLFNYFSTAQKAIAIKGTDNVRDIGGYAAADGKRVKSGMIYRGAEIDGVFDESFKITDKGINKARNKLHIKSDFDLRGNYYGYPDVSPLGTDINYYIYNVEPYERCSSPESSEAIRKLFYDLSNNNNYPVYMHCTYGLDRTGTVCYLLEALLGVSKEDLISEWELSAHAYDDISNARNNFLNFVDYFESLEGDTCQEKAENYLLSCGVTETEIDNIKNILLE